MKIIGLLLALLCLTPSAMAEDSMTLHAVNVGKADALILTSGEHVYLIDTGTEESWGQLSRALMVNGITRLDGVIITHTDEDHGGGAWALAQSSVQVDTWYASVWYNCKEKKHPAINAAALRGQEVVWLEQGMSLPLGDGTLTVLGPMYEDRDKENNNSLVLLAQSCGGSMLLTGDMELPEEEHLLDEGLIPPCDVLKVANHGERDATSQALVDTVKPKVAVISTNTEAEPDTPAKRVIKALAGAAVYQTQDSDAGVLVRIAGGKVQADNVVYTQMPDAAEGIVITAKGEDDSVCIANRGGKAVDLTDWFIRSQRGGEIFVFPEGARIEPGAEIVVVSQSSKGKGDYTWPDTSVWHKNKDDEAVLYDPYGREIARLP